MMMVGNNIRVLGTFDDVLGAVQRYRASTVAVSLAGAIGHTAMQNLSWGLEGLDVDMLVAPGVADLRPPTVASRLKLSNAVGLTSALRGDVTTADAAAVVGRRTRCHHQRWNPTESFGVVGFQQNRSVLCRSVGDL